MVQCFESTDLHGVPPLSAVACFPRIGRLAALSFRRTVGQEGTLQRGMDAHVSPAFLPPQPKLEEAEVCTEHFPKIEHRCLTYACS